MWGRGQGGNQWCFLCSPSDFSAFCRFPQTIWAFLVLIFMWVGFCTFRTLWVSLTKSSVRLGVFPCSSTPTGIFSALRLYFLAVGPWVAPSASLHNRHLAGSAGCNPAPGVYMCRNLKCEFQPVVVGTSSMPTGIPDLRCGEEGKFI